MNNKFANVPGGAHQLNDGRWMPMIGLAIAFKADNSVPSLSRRRRNETERNRELQEILDVLVEAALKAGNRLSDTTNISDNEEQLGNSLKIWADATRHFHHDEAQNSGRRYVDFGRKDLEMSLRQLQTDYLELVLINYPRDRYTGFDANYDVNRKSRQLGYQLLEENLQAFSSSCKAEIINAVQPIVDKYEVSSTTILYAFALNGGVGVVPKATTSERCLLKAVNLQLTEAEMKKLYELDRDQTFYSVYKPQNCL